MIENAQSAFSASVKSDNLPMHAIVRNRLQHLRPSDNFVSASNRLSVGCSTFDIAKFRQCIWLHRGRVQHLWHLTHSQHLQPASASSDNFASASDHIAVGCSLSGIKQTTPSVHLMASTSGAAPLATKHHFEPSYLLLFHIIIKLSRSTYFVISFLPPPSLRWAK